MGPNPFVRPNRIIGYRKSGAPIYEIAGGDGTSGNPVLDRMLEQRQKQLDFVQNLTEQAESDNRNFTESELANLNAAREMVEKLNKEIEPVEQFEQLRVSTEKASQRYSGSERRSSDDRAGRTAIRTQPREVYKSAGEVIVDRIRAFDGSDQASDRLRDSGLGHLALAQGDQARAVAGNTTTETPGVLPTPIIGTIVNDIDASRPLVTSLGPMALSGTPGKTFERPIVTQHTLAGEQVTELTDLPTQQLKIDSVPFTKKTYGGALNVSRQDVDWTQPAVWDAILRDMQDQYAVFTEAAVATDFAASPTNVAVAAATDDLKGWATAFYTAAASVYAGVFRLPDMIWCSIDMWEKIGPVTDLNRLVFAGGLPSEGNSDLSSFAGNLFNLPRVVVPKFPAGTLILGYSKRYEVYEDRIGLLQVIQPSSLGVQLGYGGYVAFKALKGAAFTAVTAPAGA